MSLTLPLALVTLLSVSVPSHAFDFSQSKLVPTSDNSVREVCGTPSMYACPGARSSVRCGCGNVLPKYEPLSHAATARMQSTIDSILLEYNKLSHMLRSAITAEASELSRQKVRITTLENNVSANSKLIRVHADGVAYNTVVSQKNAVALAALQQLRSDMRERITVFGKEVGAVVEALAQQQKTLLQQQKTLSQLQLHEPQLGLLSKRLEHRGAVDTELLARLSTIEASIGDMRAYVDRKVSAQPARDYPIKELPLWLLGLLLVIILFSVAMLLLWVFQEHRRNRANTN